LRWPQGVLFDKPILKGRTARMRTAEEIMMRCNIILDQPDIVLLVDKSSSPTAAYDMVMDATRNNETAKAARWLGVLRRDHPESLRRNHPQHSQPRIGASVFLEPEWDIAGQITFKISLCWRTNSLTKFS